MTCYRRLSIVLGVFCGLLLPPAGASADVSFNRDVRPILSDACFPCHGPDATRRKGKLRLDVEEGARRVLADGELLRRVTTTDADERMPPTSSGRSLTPAQIDAVRQWLKQGAPWQKHWSLIPPARPPVPTVADPSWPRNPIDAFILAKLRSVGLRPSPEAEKTTLLRRVSLDLTGLPPTPAEVDAFLADASPRAYEAAVDRLLRSPRYGERMAARWLDAARYADTNGYQTDGERQMFRWRDWVIDAFNANMPYDQFTIEQLAGDLLPSPTLDQRIATGFNRNHRGNSEGGIIPEEYQVEYVVDRVETTATVWLGLTLGCARCHEHKFDPISQKEFYRLFAYFNNVPEHGRAIKYGNSPPSIKAPTRSQQEQLAALDARLRAAEERCRALERRRAKAQVRWEAEAEGDWAPSRHLASHVPHPGDFDGHRVLEAGDVGKFGFYEKFTLAARVRPADGHGGTVISRMTDVDRGDGYGVRIENGRVLVHLTKRWLDDALRVQTERRLEPGRAYHIAVTYDGSRVAAGVRVYIDGRCEKVQVLLDELNQPFATKEPFRIGGGGGPQARFRGRIDDVRIYEDALEPAEIESLAVSESIADIARHPAAERTLPQARKLAACFLERHAPADVRAAHERLFALRKEREALIESFPTVMVMEEMPTPRPTHLLLRGQYDRPGEAVTPGIPASLGTLPPGAPNNRLGLARWLVAPDNPLTARVAVNRLWQMLFGTGLVKTVEDFGSQGEAPSHPELLDWLATEFVRSGWDVKAMLRLMVTSATYRQSSRLTPELRERDPDNRLLARGPRYRLPAETIRDQALAASGLLVERLGGPSVKPYQPPGLWKELTGTEEYVPDKGENLYRRSLYTFWKRTVQPPALVTFDAAGRETCVVRETRTNTPLQALNLMNDVTFVEASRVLAERVMKGTATPEERLARAFRLLTARSPRPEELRVLRDGLEHHQARFRRDPEAARKLVSVGERPRDERYDMGELAAYTTMAGVILNLDEVVTKE